MPAIQEQNELKDGIFFLDEDVEAIKSATEHYKNEWIQRRRCDRVTGHVEYTPGYYTDSLGRFMLMSQVAEHTFDDELLACDEEEGMSSHAGAEAHSSNWNVKTPEVNRVRVSSEAAEKPRSRFRRVG